MDDRTDIDALLISALYGELTPADEARLAAHLESHPADRTALADLTQTRATVRESRLVTVQVEPPQSVSARLLQEASRRAPGARRQGDPAAGWFYRFVRSFMAHPAMAAAAMLVLVVGVAATVYVRHGDSFVETRAPSAAPVQATVASAASPETVAPAPAAAPAAAASPARPAAEPPAEAQNRGSGTYGVDLDDRTAERAGERLQTAPDPRPAPSDRPVDTRGVVESSDGKGARTGVSGDSAPAPAKSAAAVDRRAKKLSGGIELRKAEPMPMDLDDGLIRRDVDRKAVSKDAQRQRAPADPAAGGAGAAAQAPATTSPSESPGADQTAAQTVAIGPRAKSRPPASKPLSRSAQDQEGQLDSPRPPAPVPTAATPPPRREGRLRFDDTAPPAADKAAGKADARTDDSAAADKLLDWARRQHASVVALVNANNCRAAASAALAIYSRAPDYYAANVATDRSVKPCLAYLNSERETEDRKRAAAKRPATNDAPQAAPAKK